MDENLADLIRSAQMLADVAKESKATGKRMPLKYDKSKWPDGPWQREPDIARWLHKGLECCIVRHPLFGILCGYVGVPASHKAHSKSYDRMHDEYEIEVHGGLTHASCDWPLQDADEREAGKEPDNYWWFGFDCAHSSDYSPHLSELYKNMDDMMNLVSRRGEVYRDFDWVRKEVNSLSDQLIAIQKGEM